MKKKVNVLLSIYKPDLKFLKEQLISIENQDYENYSVIMNDDCPDEKVDVQFIKKYLKNTPFVILPYSEKNQGYVCSFEKLVNASDGDFLFFCDQDDIWFSNKISTCVNTMEKDHSLLVVSDRQIIDENDNVIIESVRKSTSAPYQTWHTGDDIAKYNLFVTYGVGMSIACDGKFARSCVPFCRCTGHDQWLISCAATEGIVSNIEVPLVQYRKHSQNVTGTLKGISSKKDYKKFKLYKNNTFIHLFLDKYPNHKDRKEIEGFMDARYNGNIFGIFKYRYLERQIAYFEIIMNIIPNFMFSFLLKLARKINKVM